VKVAVVSSCYGEYDPPHVPTPQDTDHTIEYVMVTDGQWDEFGWRTVRESRPYVDFAVAAKLAKFRPDLYTDAAYTIWVDAGCVLAPNFVETILSTKADWKMFKGHQRSTLKEEMLLSRTMGKYYWLPLEAQVDYYLNMGYPDNELWGTGVIGRVNSPENREFGDAWLREVVRWGNQDQISFAYLRWAYYLSPTDLGDGYTTDIVQWRPH
jgi:Protein of unknown function (DUF616)